MHISIMISPLVAALVLLVLLFVRIAGKYRRHQAPRAGKTPRKGLPPGISWPRDHGARVARRHGHKRSPEWHRVAKEHLLREPACVACGYRGRGLQVHHIKPFHLHPDLELDPHNLITLCEIKSRDHHLLLGHLDDWEAYNPNVRHDVKRFYNKNATQIRADPTWQEEVQRRPTS